MDPILPMKINRIILSLIFFIILTWSCTPGKNKNTLPAVKAPAKKNVAINGELLYMQHCKECHQEDGEGTPEIYPTLVNSDYIKGDKDLLLEILIDGLNKEIIVDGIEYDGEMPKADFLTNKEIAALIQYIRVSFNKKLPAVSDDDVARARIRLRMKNKQ